MCAWRLHIRAHRRKHVTYNIGIHTYTYIRVCVYTAGEEPIGRDDPPCTFLRTYM